MVWWSGVEVEVDLVKTEIGSSHQCPATARAKLLSPLSRNCTSRNDDKKRNTPSPKQTKTLDGRRLLPPPRPVRYSKND